MKHTVVIHRVETLVQEVEINAPSKAKAIEKAVERAHTDRYEFEEVISIEYEGKIKDGQKIDAIRTPMVSQPLQANYERVCASLAKIMNLLGRYDDGEYYIGEAGKAEVDAAYKLIDELAIKSPE